MVELHSRLRWHYGSCLAADVLPRQGFLEVSLGADAFAWFVHYMARTGTVASSKFCAEAPALFVFVSHTENSATRGR